MRSDARIESHNSEQRERSAWAVADERRPKNTKRISNRTNEKRSRRATANMNIGRRVGEATDSRQACTRPCRLRSTPRHAQPQANPRDIMHDDSDK